jgi:uncharacterized protein (TIGR03437 family)
MKTITKLAGLWLLVAAAATAAPEIRAILNAASYALPGLPNSAVAQGSIFVVFGTGLGPAELRQAAGFPLPPSLGGTSVRITVGTTAVDAPLLYVWDKQVAAILPSTAPPGIGLLAVTYQGHTSQSGAFRIVRSSPGILAQNQAGSGPALAQNFNSEADQPRNTFTRPARPGQVVTLWATGLGPIAESDAEQPVPRDLDVNLQVLVGGRPATVRYKGRSRCCAGADQINFEVPREVDGCYVPVVLRVGDVTSNFTTISVAAPGADCTDLSGTTGPEIEKLQAGGVLRIGLISLSAIKVTDAFCCEPPGYYESGYASFYSSGLSRVLSRLGRPSPGSCLVFPPGQFVGFNEPQSTALEAGPALNLSGPKGARQLPRRGPGAYNEQFSSAAAQLQYLESGTYTVDNGSGGADVGAFRMTFNVPPKLTFTTQASAAGLTVTWRGGDPAGFLTITGSSARSAVTGQEATFSCTERVSAGQFTVPLYVRPDPGNGALGVDYSPQIRFRAPGLDAAFFSFFSAE